MDVLILAAGFGSRMGELTEKIPKPLLRVNQKPLISYALDLVQQISFETIYVNTHYQAETLQKFLVEHYPKVEISHEKKILGTGGGIKKIQNKDLCVLNTDNLWQDKFKLEIQKAMIFFKNNINIENLLMVSSNDTFSDLEISKEAKINFPSIRNNTQFQGCHILRNKVLETYPDMFNITDYWKDCSQRKKLFGFETPMINTHIGNKELYLKYQN
tara:strand:- start:1382 stop:2026 length:645 start_codon:yes stop_codon:yes gene_type:complete